MKKCLFIFSLLFLGCTLQGASCSTPAPVVEVPSELEVSGDVVLEYSDTETKVRINPAVLPTGTLFVRVFFLGEFWGVFSVDETWHLGPVDFLEKTTLVIYDDSEVLYSTLVVRDQ